MYITVDRCCIGFEWKGIKSGQLNSINPPHLSPLCYAPFRGMSCFSYRTPESTDNVPDWVKWSSEEYRSGLICMYRYREHWAISTHLYRGPMHIYNHSFLSLPRMLLTSGGLKQQSLSWGEKHKGYLARVSYSHLQKGSHFFFQMRLFMQ